ncbi:unnamed protein product [Didymodactylos carnosus]|uniref:Endonuclease/exonuclease/phosphatase domain-containing protein n=1 Tax=Didymodactylos carnosus TaxID=1234261 RepID=A0A814QSJ0_9BILA|nr:unnamed protein product [Didymodactylos carnosus]CAF1379299.1 unnamed protein product [Didymodactylos carnosus]CAF3888010.1 unnamed protein product [Didymodactylos carnosus]CAF4187900.1 unnamed protein product [Didymodactylos carnosus]
MDKNVDKKNQRRYENFLLFNARSLKATVEEKVSGLPHVVKVTKLDLFIDYMHEYKPTIAVVVESWLNANISDDDLLIADYQSPLRKDRAGMTGGGILVYVRNNLPCKRLVELEDQLYETIFFSVTFPTNKTFVISACYRPDWVDVTASTNHLEKSLFEIRTKATYKFTNIVILGDFNAHCYEWCETKSSTSEGKHFHEFDILPTKDNISDVNKVIVLPKLYSKCDHDVVQISYSFLNTPIREYKWCIYDYRLTNWDLFRQELSNIDWFGLIHRLTLHDIVAAIENKISEIAYLVTPHKYITVRSNDKPWFTDKLRNMSKIKHDLYIIKCQQKTYTAEKEYMQASKKFEQECRREKKSYYRKLSTDMNTSSKRNKQIFLCINSPK